VDDGDRRGLRPSMRHGAGTHSTPADHRRTGES
jgi:hypothetical protein